MNKIAKIVAVWLGATLIFTVVISVVLYDMDGTLGYFMNFLVAAGLFVPNGITGAVIQGIMSKAEYFGIASYGMASLLVGTLSLIPTYLLYLLIFGEGWLIFLNAAPAYICALTSHNITE